MRTVLAGFSLVLLASCGGGGSGGGADDENNNNPDPQPVKASASIPTNGASLTLRGVGSADFPAGFVSSAQTVTIEQVTSASLDRDAGNGADLFGVVQGSTYHIQLSGILPEALAGTSFVVRLRVPSNLARQVDETRHLAVLAWAQDYSDDDESGERLPSHELLTSNFDAATSTLTATVPAHLLTARDPATHKDAGVLFASLSIVIWDRSLFEVETNVGTQSVLAAGSEPVCGNKEWMYPLEDAPKSVAAFGELRCKTNEIFKTLCQGHSGTDLVTRNSAGMPVSGKVVKAVDSGYIVSVREQSCNCDEHWRQNVPIKCSSPPTGYALVEKLSNGEHVAYRHLKIGGLLAPGLQQEPDVERCWRDGGSGTRRYKVSRGDPLATSGETGVEGRPHLHLDFATRSNDINDPAQRSNPLCRLVSAEISATTIELERGKDERQLEVVLKDSFGRELEIRRKKGPSRSADVFLPALAEPTSPLVKFEDDSDSVLAKTIAEVLDPTVALHDHDWGENAQGISTDNGKVSLKGLKAGQTMLRLDVKLPWTTNAATATYPLGTGFDVGIRVVDDELPSPPNPPSVTANFVFTPLSKGMMHVGLMYHCSGSNCQSAGARATVTCSLSGTAPNGTFLTDTKSDLRVAGNFSGGPEGFFGDFHTWGIMNGTATVSCMAQSATYSYLGKAYALPIAAASGSN